MAGYAKALREQLKPQAKGLMSKLFENLEEKLKNPNSIEFKTLTAFIVLIASKQLAEKIVAQAWALLHHAEEQAEKLAYKRRSAAGKAVLAEEEIEQEANQQVKSSTLRTLLAESVSQLTLLEDQRAQLVREYELQLKNLKNVYDPEIKQTIADFLQIQISDEQVKGIHDLYQEREERKPEMIATMQKVGAIPELTAADATANARINANLDIGTQIQLYGRLKEALQAVAAPGSAPVSLKNLLAAVNNTHDVAHLYQQVVSAFTKDHEKALQGINEAESPLRQLVSALSKELNTPAPVFSGGSSKTEAEEEKISPSQTPRPGLF